MEMYRPYSHGRAILLPHSDEPSATIAYCNNWSDQVIILAPRIAFSDMQAAMEQVVGGKPARGGFAISLPVGAFEIAGRVPPVLMLVLVLVLVLRLSGIVCAPHMEFAPNSSVVRPPATEVQIPDSIQSLLGILRPGLPPLQSGLRSTEAHADVRIASRISLLVPIGISGQATR